MTKAAGIQSVIRGDQTGFRDRIPILEKLSPEFYAQEKEKIFRRAWLCVAHTSDLPEKGGYRVVEVPTFRASLLIVRDKEGGIRGFHNICRHRGNKLVRGGIGTKTNFACGFHGWAWSAKGDLTLVPDEAQFQNLPKDELGLIPIHTEVWEGFVFVNFDKAPRTTLREWIGEMYGEFAGYFDGKEKLTRYQVEVNCNWNMALGAFIEGYHTKYLHRLTAPDYQGGRSNPHRHRPLIETLERHTRYSAPRNPDHVATPAEIAAYKYGRKLTPAFDNDNTGLPPGVNPLRSDTWAFDVVKLFPNLVMLNSNSWHLAIWFWPVDEVRTVIRAERLFYKAKNAGERFGQAFSKVRAREVLREDLNTLEATQDALMSGMMEHIYLSQQELPIQHHFKVAEDMIAQP